MAVGDDHPTRITRPGVIGAMRFASLDTTRPATSTQIDRQLVEMARSYGLGDITQLPPSEVPRVLERMMDLMRQAAAVEREHAELVAECQRLIQQYRLSREQANDCEKDTPVVSAVMAALSGQFFSGDGSTYLFSLQLATSTYVAYQAAFDGYTPLSRAAHDQLVETANRQVAQSFERAYADDPERGRRLAQSHQRATEAIRDASRAPSGRLGGHAAAITEHARLSAEELNTIAEQISGIIRSATANGGQLTPEQRASIMTLGRRVQAHYDAIGVLAMAADPSQFNHRLSMLERSGVIDAARVEELRRLRLQSLPEDNEERQRLLTQLPPGHADRALLEATPEVRASARRELEQGINGATVDMLSRDPGNGQPRPLSTEAAAEVRRLQTEMHALPENDPRRAQLREQIGRHMGPAWRAHGEQEQARINGLIRAAGRDGPEGDAARAALRAWAERGRDLFRQMQRYGSETSVDELRRDLNRGLLDMQDYRKKERRDR